MTRPRPDGGFTLVELMMAVTAIMVLAAVALPQAAGYLRQTRLQAAKPVLAEIAARQRAFMMENGQYCCSTGTLDENTLTAQLGVNLASTGDFCFVVICQDATLCQQTSGPGFISASSGKAPDFEVWAILQDTASGTDAGPGNTSCTPAIGKAAPSGFVAAATSGAAARGGQVVVLRYPTPQNGQGVAGAYHAVPFLWHDGISLSDAMLP